MYASAYRTHTCGEFRESHIGQTARVAGWVENIRDHGGVQFIDLRDHYGTLQVVIKDEEMLKGVSRESTICVSGPIVRRDPDTINPKIETGMVELRAETLTLLGKCTGAFPFEVISSKESREDLRLKYRFLDLRNRKVHKNIVLRAQLLSYLRSKMEEMGKNAHKVSIKDVEDKIYVELCNILRTEKP